MQKKMYPHSNPSGGPSCGGIPKTGACPKQVVLYLVVPQTAWLVRISYPTQQDLFVEKLFHSPRRWSSANCRQRKQRVALPTIMAGGFSKWKIVFQIPPVSVHDGWREGISRRTCTCLPFKTCFRCSYWHCNWVSHES